jgi:hypothetical protein
LWIIRSKTLIEWNKNWLNGCPRELKNGNGIGEMACNLIGTAGDQEQTMAINDFI